jgi:mannosyltransferase OCH1-like enzyme
MIPKIIHYCWFGNHPKPKSVQKYIEGWYKKLPDFEIIEWNESNFDINICKYTKQAYEAKKYAFVSDYARLLALYNHGGIYLDTDVEVFKDLTPLLNIADCLFGFEEKEYVATSTMLAKPQQLFIKQFLNSYHQRHFINDDESLDMKTNVEVLTEMLSAEGLVCDGTSQTIDVCGSEITVLPQEYLSPYDYINC